MCQASSVTGCRVGHPSAIAYTSTGHGQAAWACRDPTQTKTKTNIEHSTVRLPGDLPEVLDTSRWEQSDLPTRPEGVRRLLSNSLPIGE